MQDLSHALVQGAGGEAAVFSYRGDRDAADRMYIAMDAMGVTARAVEAFYDLDSLGHPGDMTLTKEELRFITESSASKVEDQMEGDRVTTPQEQLLRRYARGCLALDQILDKRTVSKVPGEIDKVTGQRIALLLAFRYVQDYYARYYRAFLPPELNVKTANMSKEAEAFRTLFVDHEFPQMPNISDRVLIIRGAQHMSEVYRGENVSSVTVEEALAICDEEEAKEFEARQAADEEVDLTELVGKRIRAVRLALNLTQSELASIEGPSDHIETQEERDARRIFSVSYISAVERGQILPSLKALMKLGRRLGVPAYKLLPRYI